MAFSTPVLLLVFNRPEHTKRVFQQIRQIKPTQLFISADGPRSNVLSDLDKCCAVRNIVNEIDWDCTVHTNFSDENLGCRKAVPAGISWFFKHVEAGIILEDDCLPGTAFFSFCAAMLEKYKDDREVWHVSGLNPGVQFNEVESAGYVFSRFPFVWGWATWRRAWEQFDPYFSSLEDSWHNSESGLSALSNDVTVRWYLYDKFLCTRDGELNTWDYAWFYSILKGRGFCLNPVRNMVRNIGFDETATHTRTDRWRKLHNSNMDQAAVIEDPAGRNPMPKTEYSFFLSSQKKGLGLLLRRLAPQLFFKPTPKRPSQIPVWQSRFWIKTTFSS